MATSAEQQLYPFSTNDGQAIPLEIIRPLGLTVATVAGGGSNITLPSSVSVCLLYSNVDLVIDFLLASITPVGNHTSALMLPAGTMVTAILPDITTLRALPLLGVGGFLSIQTLQKWAGIGTQRQLNRR